MRDTMTNDDLKILGFIVNIIGFMIAIFTVGSMALTICFGLSMMFYIHAILIPKQILANPGGM